MTAINLRVGSIEAETARNNRLTVEEQLSRVTFYFGPVALARCTWATDHQRGEAVLRHSAMTRGSDRWFTGPEFSL